MAFDDIAVDATVIVLVGPNRAGNTADHRTNHGAFKDTDARDQGTGARTDSTANRGAGRDAAKRRIVTRGWPS